MKHLFYQSTAAEVKQRVLSVKPDSPRQWGKMTAAQALAHCATVMEWAVDDVRPRRMLLGYVFGPLVKRKVLGEGPMARNAPTDTLLVVSDPRDLAAEQQRLCALIDRFCAGGPEKCSKHPHSFFGRLAPGEYAVLMYKHLDHHLRQFQA